MGNAVEEEIEMRAVSGRPALARKARQAKLLLFITTSGTETQAVS